MAAALARPVVETSLRIGLVAEGSPLRLQGSQIPRLQRQQLPAPAVCHWLVR